MNSCRRLRGAENLSFEIIQATAEISNPNKAVIDELRAQFGGLRSTRKDKYCPGSHTLRAQKGYIISLKKGRFVQVITAKLIWLAIADRHLNLR
jgi:hypothetical protein